MRLIYKKANSLLSLFDLTFVKINFTIKKKALIRFSFVVVLFPTSTARLANFLHFRH